jgi:hypothetical protein
MYNVSIYQQQKILGLYPVSYVQHKILGVFLHILARAQDTMGFYLYPNTDLIILTIQVPFSKRNWGGGGFGFNWTMHALSV